MLKCISSQLLVSGGSKGGQHKLDLFFLSFSSFVLVEVTMVMDIPRKTRK